ncbi:MAG: terminase large subunit domain-containing protein [Candidatus Zixiibacteriota bacterium]
MTKARKAPRPGWRSLTKQEWRRALADPNHFAQRLLNVQPHPGQARWLANATARQNLLVTGNRWGKSVASAIKALHRALFQIRDPRFDVRGRYRVITAAITQDQAGIIFGEALRMARQSPFVEPLIQEISRSPFPRLKFGNGSVIEARSTQNRGEYLLGNDYDYFVFDEVAFEPHAEYVVEEVIQMRLVDREGALDLVSTPNGKNWFYRRCCELQSDSASDYVQQGDSRENNFISGDYLEKRIELFSAERVAQNIMGHFVDSGREIISGADIDAALHENQRVHRSQAGDIQRFISGWDRARKRTATVGVTVAVNQLGRARVVALERIRRMNWNYVFERIRNRHREFPGSLIIDASGLGDVVVHELSDLAPTPFVFTEKSKAALLTNLELAHTRREIAYDRWEIRDVDGKIWSLEDELREATWENNGRCDGLMALALALWPLRWQERARITDPRIGAI